VPLDSFFQGGGYRRPPEAFSLIPDSRKPGTDSFSSHVSQSFQNRLKRSGEARCNTGLGETRVLKHFQERMPYRLFVPDAP
jgi:hypothetical protein